MSGFPYPSQKVSGLLNDLLYKVTHGDLKVSDATEIEHIAASEIPALPSYIKREHLQGKPAFLMIPKSRILPSLLSPISIHFDKDLYVEHRHSRDQ